MASLTFPVEADQTYKNAFASLARVKGLTMATLVRRALDKEYGQELQPFLSFFEESDARNHQSLISGISSDADHEPQP
jgi:hypothetical protein